MDLSEKAEETPDVILAGDLHESAFETTETELIPADELTGEDQFPKYGDFLEAVEYSPYDGTCRGTVWIEVPSDLAGILLERELTDGTRWVVEQSRKVDSEWQFEVSEVSET